MRTKIEVNHVVNLWNMNFDEETIISISLLLLSLLLLHTHTTHHHNGLQIICIIYVRLIFLCSLTFLVKLVFLFRFSLKLFFSFCALVTIYCLIGRFQLFIVPMTEHAIDNFRVNQINEEFTGSIHLWVEKLAWK